MPPAPEPAPAGAPGGRPSAAEPDLDRILTVPNALSLVRLACVPLFLWLLFGRDNPHGAAWLLAVLGATDWVDGYIARRFNQVSDFGKILDPTADRVLLLVGVAAIAVDGAVPLWVAVATLLREGLVAIAALAIAAAGARRMEVRWVGKAGTFGLLIAFPLFLASHSDLSWHETARPLAWIAVIPGLIFGWIAAAAYVPDARQAVVEGRAARAAESEARS